MLAFYHRRCGSPRSGRLFKDLSLPYYERFYRDFSKRHGISGSVPHTARHSGPTDDRLHHRTTEQRLALRGRWLAPKSVRRYTKPSRMLALTSRLPSSLTSMASSIQPLLCKGLKDSLRLPPESQLTGETWLRRIES